MFYLYVLFYNRGLGMNVRLQPIAAALQGQYAIV